MASSRTRQKHEVLQLMRRLGMTDRLSDAERELPEVVDLDRDAEKLARLGLSAERAMALLGASP